MAITDDEIYAWLNDDRDPGDENDNFSDDEEEESDDEDFSGGVKQPVNPHLPFLPDGAKLKIPVVKEELVSAV